MAEVYDLTPVTEAVETNNTWVYSVAQSESSDTELPVGLSGFSPLTFGIIVTDKLQRAEGSVYFGGSSAPLIQIWS